MRALVTWPWPGNVRELENFIEPSVTLSRGPSLRAPLDELRAVAADTTGGFTLGSQIISAAFSGKPVRYSALPQFVLGCSGRP